VFYVIFAVGLDGEELERENSIFNSVSQLKR
jgi:hypothetical protein